MSIDHFLELAAEEAENIFAFKERFKIEAQKRLRAIAEKMRPKRRKKKMKLTFIGIHIRYVKIRREST